MYSAVQSLSVSFGNVECSSVQISLARCSDCPVWYFPVQSRVMQCGEVKLRVRQVGPVKCMPSSSIFWSAVRLSTVHSTDMRSSTCSEICARPAQFQFIPFQLSTFQSSIAQIYLSQQQLSLVQSSAVQSTAEQCNP